MTYRRLLIVNIVVIFLVIIAGFVAYYLYNQSTLYITTDDAQVTGQQIPIAAPATGKLTDWRGIRSNVSVVSRQVV
ncbi:MAG TPA: secretion protein HlyD [Alicyclobacillus sp.]|nr:secretion protein HlyD [Alicyclobacillus sp.]